jgi:hypothetical protein
MRITQSTFTPLDPNHFLPVFQDLHFLFPAFFIPGNCTQGHFYNNVFPEATGFIIPASSFPVFSQYVFIITQMEQGPEVFIAFQDDMPASASITTIGAAHGSKLIPHKMPAARSTMTTAAKDPDLVNKIAFFQYFMFALPCKYIRSVIPFTMKLVILLLAVSAMLSETCKNNKQNNVIPACVQQKIDSIKLLPRFNPPAQVDEYVYNGKKVFLFSSDCCDQYNSLVDEHCNYVCAPGGGITGKGDGACADFDKNAKHIKLVWKDPR